MALVFVPSHVNETTAPVDNLGGILSVVLVGALILGINFAPVPNKGALAVGLLVVAAAALVAFAIRQRRAANPLYDPKVAARPTFWVAACAGIIVFGSLMAAAFVSQQYLQNVLGYSTIEAGAAILPAVVVHGHRRAPLGEARRGARRPLHPPARLRLPPGGVPLDAAVLEGGLLLLGDRARLRLHRDRRRPRRNACLPLAHGLRPGRARGDGVGHRRPPARPRRRPAHLRPRRPARGRLRRRDGRRDRVVAAGADASPTRPRASCSSPTRARPTWPRRTRSTRARSSPRPSSRSCRATTGPTPPVRLRSLPARRSCSSSSPGRMRKNDCLPATDPPTLPDRGGCDDDDDVRREAGLGDGAPAHRAGPPARLVAPLDRRAARRLLDRARRGGQRASAPRSWPPP